MVCLLLSPILLIFAIPLLLGAGLDIFAMAGEGPVALAFCVPAALMLVHAMSPNALRQVAAFSRTHLPHRRATNLHYAP